ncbi:MAG: thioredoxin domain-containing protein [Eudoraea sp.]|nr:thioredoxin domain-containing protein [Eudoraea sp.]
MPHTNDLIRETSPYLLQHAHNPVDWKAWNPEVLAKAKKENKLLLISIGYAACHWCHVMEHECFEDVEVAGVMNQHFVNIKIDREERPDVDHIYMDALQMMTGSGGWPLNIVALPDGRPFWGATFVKKDNWMKVLDQLATLYKSDPKKVTEYAENLAKGLHSINIIPTPEKQETITKEEIKSAVSQWSQYFDTFLGGYKRAPKFMMPVNLDFLLHYATLFQDREITNYVHTTLTRMAYGGIYDHLGGGFSRYSVDTKWHVPHFEKMLYDNAQLISLYAKAYGATGNLLYKKVVEETIAFATRELMSPEGGFYSSLDADSLDTKGNLKEGAYYVWTEAELEDLLKSDFDLFKDYYNINSYGFWEEEFYVLIRDATDKEIAEKHSLDVETLRKRIHTSKELLLTKRGSRPRPWLDDKILTSWNALMIKGLTEAYRYLGNTDHLIMAKSTASFLEKKVFKEDGGLYHNYKEGKSTIEGFLEDYATLINAWLALYEVTFDEDWLEKSRVLMSYCLDHFLQQESGLFYFTSDTQELIVRRSLETADNVIPASNSIMAHCLFKLSGFYPEANYLVHFEKMAAHMRESILDNPNSHAHWLQLPLFQIFPFKEIVITGSSCKEFAAVLRQRYLPNILLAGTETEGSLNLFKNRMGSEKTLIYVCQNGACQLPVSSTEEALSML